MMVSSRMPSATAKPSSVKKVAGIVARTANVPASTNPAEVITPPVVASPVRGVALAGFFPDPGHQEDVVVDAEGDQEHEDEQWERGIGPAEPEHVVEEERADTEGGSEGEHHRGGQDQRRHHRPQQQREDDQDHDEDGRDDQGAVVRGGACHVQDDRGGTGRSRSVLGAVAEKTALFSTFGGNPVACAAALAVLAVIEDENLVKTRRGSVPTSGKAWRNSLTATLSSGMCGAKACYSVSSSSKTRRRWRPRQIGPARWPRRCANGGYCSARPGRPETC